ncbi:MAG TPA: amidohydrolase family protein [archaeon]|nr:amidohydrolase family protein [archaeon]
MESFWKKAGRVCLALVLTLVLAGAAAAKDRTTLVIGLHENTPRVFALKASRLVLAPGRVMENAVLVVRDGMIEAVGRGVKVPGDAVVLDLTGKTVYPGLIDLYTDYGLPQKAGKNAGREVRPGPRHWNRAVQPELRAVDLWRPDKARAVSLRKSGFTAAAVFPQMGLFRGSGALVLTGDTLDSGVVLREDLALAMGLRSGINENDFPSGYPYSLMGGIALIRQTFLDALWYTAAWGAYTRAPSGQSQPERNLSLAALEPYAKGQRPVVLETESELDILRANAIAREFGLEVWAVASGTEYRRLGEIKQTGLKLIVPLVFPAAPDVSTPSKEVDVSLRELRHWDFAPENPARLAETGVDFVLTGAGLKKGEDFLPALRRAVKRGLPEDRALAALTITPARWLKLESLLGSLKPGKIANFMVTDGDLFQENTAVISTWVAGQCFEITTLPLVEARGTWKIVISSGDKKLEGLLQISGKPDNLQAELGSAGQKIKVSKIELEKRLLSLSFPGDSLNLAGVARLEGIIEEQSISGRGNWGDGAALGWLAQISTPWQENLDTVKPRPEKPAEFAVVCPEGAFGRTAPPEQPELLLVKGATIWTCGPEGVLDKADLLVSRGRIEKIGRDLSSPPGAKVIDASGKHVTPGLIDAHSHLAIEDGIAEIPYVDSETRIADVINCDGINIYRQLAGGLTCALLCHGGVNPIGGQNALVKLRWGELPEGMLFAEGMPTIKFALGENVAHNWNREPTSFTRYPRTRMGVVQFFRDWFAAAKDYRRRWEIYQQDKKKNPDLVPPRKDLRLEPLLEVLDGKRWVHCHCYRQDEILAMLRLAEEVGFKVSVLIHVLEGYKVAEALKKYGAMPTTFSDEWGYKFETYDAIPYNGALMSSQGLLVSFNSDNWELGRRMNLEAAKAVKYGGLQPQEALKLVTINPACQLGVSHRTGSLEKGKDADFVIWSGDPLSTYSVCEQTWIDGRRYFSREEDRSFQRKAQEERVALVQKILGGKNGKK